MIYVGGLIGFITGVLFGACFAMIKDDDHTVKSFRVTRDGKQVLLKNSNTEETKWYYLKEEK